MTPEREKELKQFVEDRIDEISLELFNYLYWDDAVENGEITDDELRYFEDNYRITTGLIRK